MSSLTNPSAQFLAVTPSDTTVLQQVRGVYVGGTGDIVVKNQLGVAVTFVAVPAGFVLPIMGTQIMATGTGASGIVALF